MAVISLNESALLAGLPRISAQRSMQGLVPGTGGCGAQSHSVEKVRFGPRQPLAAEDKTSPEEQQNSLPQESFSDPIQLWDNVRSKPTSRLKKLKVASSIQDQLEVGMCRNSCEDGRLSDTVDALNLLVQRGCHVSSTLLYHVLKKCIAHKNLVLGRRIHALTVQGGYEGDPFLATHLISLYASHGKLEEAMSVFSKVSTPDAHNWATIIFAYGRHGQAAQAIRLYQQMRESNIKPDNRVYAAVLKACASARNLVVGKMVYAHVLASPGKPNIFVQNGLLDMYVKCRSLEDARRVFDRLRNKDVVSWTTMIAGYAQQGMGLEALSLYRRMQQEGLSPDSVTFVCLLRACASVGVEALHDGKQLHAQIEQRGLQNNVAIGGSLIHMYVKCGSLEDARSMFDRLPDRNLVTWTAMIAGYAQAGMGQEALRLYRMMQQEGCSPPDSVTFLCLLQACASVGIGALHEGKQVHAQIDERGLQDDVVLGGSLVNMYAKCGSVEDARRVFDRLQDRNVVTWTAMIAGYAKQEMGHEALSLYKSMQEEGLSLPSSVTFVCLLQACASVGVAALDEGKQLHAQIDEQGLQGDVVVGCSLVNMYAKCGCLEDARRVFDRLPEKNILTWTAIIASYAEQGMGLEALSLYHGMQQEGLSAPDSITFLCLLQACASVGAGALHQGKQLHAEIEERRLETDVVLGGSMVNMYANCGSLEDARSMFDRLPDRNVVTWNVMFAAYAKQGMGQEALNLYGTMQQEGLASPDSVTFVCLLQACAAVASLLLGKHLHEEIKERGMQADVAVGAALVYMYAKCGSMSDSQEVFDSMPERTIEAWGALIGGYTRQGDSEVVFDLLDKMTLEGLKPNGITFLSVLTVCSHVGLVDKGREYFETMRTDYGISPTAEHYTCMIDLLARAGHLVEALQMAKTMPSLSNGALWHTLLSACEKWDNFEIGRQAFEFAVSLDGKDAAAYVLMSNIYARAQMWEEAREMQARRVRCGAWKQPGQCWWTDMDGVLHTFVGGDRMHPAVNERMQAPQSEARLAAC